MPNLSESVRGIPPGASSSPSGKTGLVADPSRGYVVTPDGRILPPEAYNPKAWHILVEGGR